MSKDGAGTRSCCEGQGQIAKARDAAQEARAGLGQRACQMCGATWQEYVHKCGDGGCDAEAKQLREELEEWKRGQQQLAHQQPSTAKLLEVARQFLRSYVDTARELDGLREELEHVRIAAEGHFEKDGLNIPIPLARRVYLMSCELTKLREATNCAQP